MNVKVYLILIVSSVYTNAQLNFNGGFGGQNNRIYSSNQNGFQSFPSSNGLYGYPSYRDFQPNNVISSQGSVGLPIEQNNLIQNQIPQSFPQNNIQASSFPTGQNLIQPFQNQIPQSFPQNNFLPSQTSDTFSSGQNLVQPFQNSFPQSFPSDGNAFDFSQNSHNALPTIPLAESGSLLPSFPGIGSSNQSSSTTSPNAESFNQSSLPASPNAVSFNQGSLPSIPVGESFNGGSFPPSQTSDVFSSGQNLVQPFQNSFPQSFPSDGNAFDFSQNSHNALPTIPLAESGSLLPSFPGIASSNQGSSTPSPNAGSFNQGSLPSIPVGESFNEGSFPPSQTSDLFSGQNLGQPFQNSFPQSFPSDGNAFDFSQNSHNALPTIHLAESGSLLPSFPGISPTPSPNAESFIQGSPPSIPVGERFNEGSSPAIADQPNSVPTIPNVITDSSPVAVHEEAKQENVVDEEWEAYKAKYEKTFANAGEDDQKKQVYYSNKKQIEDFNAVGIGFHLGMNAFGDLTLEQFNNMYNGLSLKARKGNGSTYIPSGFVAKPKLVDWRNYTGAVTSVKDQGNCFSCWAFTAAAVLESHWWRKTGETVDVSEQNILDCRNDEEKDSCAPGFYSNAWQYIKDNGGVDGEEIYPYESHNNMNFTCRFRPEGVVAKVTGIVELPEKDEEAMELAVSTQGPIAAAIDANIFTQQFYADGVFKSAEKDDSGNYLNAKCTEEINHAVTIVGFGEEENGQKYWLIKNSYGTSWGMNGYMKLARRENMCGISLFPAYPLV